MCDKNPIYNLIYIIKNIYYIIYIIFYQFKLDLLNSITIIPNVIT